MIKKITHLEKQVLDAIQTFTAEDFTSDNGNWAYVNELAETIDPSKLRGLLTTLQLKGILNFGQTDYDNYVEVSKDYFIETGNYTETGSPEIKFTNIEIK